MSLQVENLDNNMAKLTIEVAADVVEAAIESAYQKQKRNINIPGFRKGKVTRKVVEKMYGPAVFYDDAINEMIPEAYDKALEEYDGEVVAYPKIDIVQIEAGKPFIFTAEVILKPVATLGTYKGVKVEKMETTVSEEEVDQAIEQERERNARTVAVTERAVKSGDETIIDFEGFVDGVAFEGGKGENYPLTIGSGAFIPGFEDQLIDKNIGEDVEVNVTFPENYQAEDLAGKAAMFKCVVREIKEKQLPELDDEFAAEVSEFDTLAEYKEDVKKNLEEKKADEVAAAKETAVLDAIIADAKMEIPEEMVSFRQRRMLDDFAARFQGQGLSLQQYYQFTGMNEQMMMDQLKPRAEQEIKSELVLEAVVAAENIVPSEAEYTEEIGRLAESYQMEVKDVEERLGEKGKKQVMNDLAVRAAAKLVVDAAVEE
ncbi:MAG: trigger factor [Lachnospiraceae bacterium]|nr:trigger factor [Lachnospiraceae bacterium]